MGHEEEQESQYIIDLENKVRQGLRELPLSELAQLYHEPAHRGLEAVALARLANWANSEDSWARIWLAYGDVWIEMTESAYREAVELLQPLLDAGGEVQAAAAQLTAAALTELQELMPEDNIAYLESAVAAAPEWTRNRKLLAQAYLARGDQGSAVSQLELAKSTLIASDDGLSVTERSFHECLTGRLASQESLDRVLRKRA